MVEFTYQMMLSTLQTVALIVGIVYYITIMRNQQKTRELALKAQEQATETRQTQIFMQIYERLNSEEVAKSWAELINMKVPDYDEFLQKYDSSVNPAHYAKRVNIWYSFHAIGELLRMGTISLDLVHRLQLSPMVIAMWENWEHLIREIRARENLPEYGEGFEYLYHELKRLRREKGHQEYRYPAPRQ
jgi:hypothetical protein